MSKHTPGPWGAERYQGEINIVSCNKRDAEEKDLGIVYVLARGIGGMIHGENFDDRSEVEANALLIAAAPELLEALQAMVDVCESPDFDGAPSDAHMLQARAAIAKARGEA